MFDTGTQIIESLQSLGVTVRVVGSDGLRLEPASKIPKEMISIIRDAKAAILRALRSRKPTCSLDCYEVEAGIWIHRPWTGCTTFKIEESGVTPGKREISKTCPPDERLAKDGSECNKGNHGNSN